MRPVLRGLCRYESLKNGAVDLEDLARMNDAITVQDHNEYLAHEARAATDRRR